MALSHDASQLASLLAALTQPDTEAIRQAELALKPLLKDHRCVPALVEILKSKDTQVSLPKMVIVVRCECYIKSVDCLVGWRRMRNLPSGVAWLSSCWWMFCCMHYFIECYISC
jgi:hypothetical protein